MGYYGEGLLGYSSSLQAQLCQISQLKGEDKMSVVEKIKQLSLSKGDRLLRKYNLVDESGSLTGDGKAVLFDILLADHKEDLVAKVEQLDKDEKSKKK